MSNLPGRRSGALPPQHSTLALDDLWLRCFALGSMITQTQRGRSSGESYAPVGTNTT